MLCLVADNEREVEAEPIGRIIAARLRAAMKAKGWTQGQVHYQVNRGLPQGDELLSLKTVGQLLRGSQVNPSFGTVLAVSQALGLTPDQVAGVAPMPETAPLPIEDDVTARVGRIENVLDQLLERLAERSESLGATPIASDGKAPRRLGAVPTQSQRRKA